MLPSQEPAARLNNNKCLWGALQTVSVITDYVFRKHNIATHVSLFVINLYTKCVNVCACMDECMCTCT